MCFIASGNAGLFVFAWTSRCDVASNGESVNSRRIDLIFSMYDDVCLLLSSEIIMIIDIKVVLTPSMSR